MLRVGRRRPRPLRGSPGAYPSHARSGGEGGRATKSWGGGGGGRGRGGGGGGGPYPERSPTRPLGKRRKSSTLRVERRTPDGRAERVLSTLPHASRGGGITPARRALR